MERASICRILDANLNRAGEALRVIEEYARFARNHAAWARTLREMRHLLVGLPRTLGIELADRLGARDARADVGAHQSPPPAYVDETDLLAANFSRLGEALRSVAEYGRLLPPGPGPAQAEALRFDAYKLQTQIAADSPRQRLAEARLYFILSGELAPEDPAAMARAAVQGGADVVQLRGFDLRDRELLSLARHVADETRAQDALFILNDRLDLAMALDADGVHLGREDMPLAEACALRPAGLLVGRSVRSAQEAADALGHGADYVGLGAVFPSSIKPNRPVLGPEEAARVFAEVPSPVFPIGGIGLSQIDTLAALGVTRACVSSALMTSDDVKATAHAMAKALAAVENNPGGSSEDGPPNE